MLSCDGLRPKFIYLLAKKSKEKKHQNPNHKRLHNKKMPPNERFQLNQVQNMQAFNKEKNV